MVCGEVVLDGSIRTHLQEALLASDSKTPVPSGEEQGLLKLLTQREKEILCLLMDGLSNQEVAARLFISEPTVKKNVSRIIDKLQVQNRVQAAVYAARHLPTSLSGIQKDIHLIPLRRRSRVSFISYR